MTKVRSVPTKPRVLFASAEFAPLSRVGGLAAAAAGLVGELRRQSIDVQVVLADYAATPLEDETIEELDVPEWAGPATARTGVMAGVGNVTLVDAYGIRRSHPYVQPDGQGWFDNDRRFFAFSCAIAQLAKQNLPDILHLNDWHTASALGYLAEPPPSVLTIHTLGYQGQTNRGWLTGFINRPDAFELHGDCNPLAGGIRTADLVVAVSPNYAAEITTPQGGFGLDELLREKDDRLVGILNGIDDREWDPATDPHLVANYSAADLSGKALNKAAILERCGLHDWGGPVITMVTRLVHQKGVDLVCAIAPFLSSVGATLIVLGDGEQGLADAMQATADQYPQRVSFVRGYDESLAHQLFAGADVFVMPSRFEPCGLAQMQAMRYGTLPLVSDVGGLHDTVIDVDVDSSRGTGIVVAGPTAQALTDGLHRIAKAWGQARRRAAMQRRGMTTDWSWRAPAAKQIEWYDRLIAERV